MIPLRVPEGVPSRRLIEGGRLRCPHCKMLRNILAFKAFDVDEEFIDELNTVLKCPCGHIFSPGPSSRELSHMLQAIAADG